MRPTIIQPGKKHPDRSENYIMVVNLISIDTGYMEAM